MVRQGLGGLGALNIITVKAGFENVIVPNCVTCILGYMYAIITDMRACEKGYQRIRTSGDMVETG